MARIQHQHMPPKDMTSPMLEVSVGCTHGACLFCDIFNGIPFEPIPLDEVIQSIEDLAKVTMQHKHRVYLAGGNPFALPTEHLMRIFDEVEARMPQINGYGGFARIEDIANKSDDELALLASRGVDEIGIGAESGYDPALAFMQKKCTGADIVEQGRRLHAAGINFTFFYLTGLAGAGLGQENALASAQVFSQAAPNRILVVCLTPTKTWKLKACIQDGSWVPPTELEMAQEIRTFIANLTCPTNIVASHDSDIVKFEGMVPKDQENMLKLLDARMEHWNERSARKLRDLIHHAGFYDD
ncbi:MAG: radical SAM protein [Coriobacteriia bacterium]|nr:radical SAM protein [Coriobacteriia bacterium]